MISTKMWYITIINLIQGIYVPIKPHITSTLQVLGIVIG